MGARTAEKRRHRSVRLELPSERALVVAIISDTHSNPHPASVSLVAKQKPDAIVHGGDIGALDVLDAFSKIAPLIAVRGNIDAQGAAPDSVDIAFTEGDVVRMRMLLIHQAVYGPKLRADVARLAKSYEADLVVCGHSHVPLLVRDRGMTVFNPGSIGPRRFHLPITFGVLEISARAASLRHMSCESGERWLP